MTDTTAKVIDLGSLLPGQSVLDLVGPFRGECGICGGPDARHRLFDAIQEQQRAGDPSSLVAQNYDMPVEQVEAIAAAPRWAHDDQVREGWR